MLCCCCCCCCCCAASNSRSCYVIFTGPEESVAKVGRALVRLGGAQDGWPRARSNFARRSLSKKRALPSTLGLALASNSALAARRRRRRDVVDNDDSAQREGDENFSGTGRAEREEKEEEEEAIKFVNWCARFGRLTSRRAITLRSSPVRFGGIVRARDALLGQSLSEAQPAERLDLVGRRTSKHTRRQAQDLRPSAPGRRAGPARLELRRHSGQSHGQFRIKHAPASARLELLIYISI